MKGDLSDIRKWVIKDQGIQYCIAYEIYEDRVEVKIIRVGTRENFYDELKTRNLVAFVKNRTGISIN